MHRIQAIANRPFVNKKMYRLPDMHRKVITEEIHRLLERNIVSKSKSGLNAPLLSVPKKSTNGEKRWREVVKKTKSNNNKRSVSLTKDRGYTRSTRFFKIIQNLGSGFRTHAVMSTS